MIYAERGGMRYPLHLGDRVEKIRLIGKLRGIGNWYLFLISRAEYWHERGRCSRSPLGGRLATTLVATISAVIFFFLLRRRDRFS